MLSAFIKFNIYLDVLQGFYMPNSPLQLHRKNVCVRTNCNYYGTFINIQWKWARLI